MNNKLIAVASAAAIALTAVATPDKVEARSNGWWIPGAVIGGLALGALAARPYYYGPGYDGYAYAPGPVYGPYDYEYGQYYNGSGPYYYGGPRSYYGRPYRHWTEF
jgi:hypothetical protein